MMKAFVVIASATHSCGHQLPARMLLRLHRTRKVEGTQDDATKDSAQVVGVTRHHNDANGGLQTGGVRA